MSDATDRVIALKLLIDRVQPESEPKLTTGQVELELDRAKLAAEWKPETAYQHGALWMVPPVRNGHSYAVYTPGTSGATLPAGSYSTVNGSRFSESGGLVWQEAGTDRFNGGIPGAEFNVYDIGRAAAQCWAIKERFAAQFVADGDVSFEQIYEHCKEQRQEFRAFRRPMRIVKG